MFEVFDARLHGQDRLVVTTSPKNRVLRLSRALHRKLDSDRVLLLFDAESGQIGVSPAAADNAASLPVHPRSLAVGCAAFLRTIGETGEDRAWPMVDAGDGAWMSVTAHPGTASDAPNTTWQSVAEHYSRQLASPPAGWFTLGHHVGVEGPLEFWGQSIDGLPLWERPAPPAPSAG